MQYGLTKQLTTHHPVKVAFHEYIALAHDVRRARGVRTKRGAAARARLAAYFRTLIVMRHLLVERADDLVGPGTVSLRLNE